MSEFADDVVAVVRSIPAGTVLSYGEVAAEAGRPGAARGVGSVLGSDDSGDLPWWRVVSAAGRISSPSPERQARLLESEGWRVARPSYRLERDESAGRSPHSRVQEM